MELLSPVQEKFILHWGEMGARWGINRTVAQIHALLYLSPEPLTAEDIARLLSVARSNVSNSLKELQGWGIVRIVHVMGDRRDHFESLKDVWQMFQIIIEERKRREVDPTVAMLEACSEELRGSGAVDTYTEERLREMLEFFETTNSFYQEVHRLPAGAIRQAAKLKGKWRKLFGPKAAVHRG